MKTESQIRALTTRLIQLLVLFEVLWAVVFLFGLTFKWSGLTDQLTSAFFGAGFCSLVLIAALVALNVVTNFNIVSKALEQTGGSRVDEPRVKYWPLLTGAGLLIVLVVGALALAEARLYRTKKIEVEGKIESVADSPLITNALKAISSDAKVVELRHVREGIAAAIQSGNRVSLLIPRESNGVRSFYEFSGWWWGGKDDEPISAMSLPRFVPTPNEEKEFAELVAGKLTKFSLKSGSEVRSFRRIKKPEGEIIILIDTNRMYGDRSLSSSS